MQKTGKVPITIADNPYKVTYVTSGFSLDCILSSYHDFQPLQDVAKGGDKTNERTKRERCVGIWAHSAKSSFIARYCAWGRFFTRAGPKISVTRQIGAE